MNLGQFACAAVTLLMVGSVGVDLTSARPSISGDAIFSSGAPSYGAASSQEKGRYKREGDDCVWATTDSGPNQCTPVTRGRFKKGGNDSCTWDSNDAGPDQCKPPRGRWKKGSGDDCTWDPKDDGPNQCNPRRARARK
jgi:hypothetical protein